MESKTNILLPKGIKASNVRVSILNDKIEVKYDLFMDGDFFVLEDNAIGIYNGNYEAFGTLIPFYIGIKNNGELVKHTPQLNDGFGLLEEARLATEEEKEHFLLRLRNEFKLDWNPDKKCLEEIYQPKFGDIVKVVCKNSTQSRNCIICIYPDKKFEESNHFFDIANVSLSGKLYKNCGSHGVEIFPATEEEKQELFNALAEKGKQWNPETKRIENWRANKGEFYYYIDSDLKVKFERELNNGINYMHYISGNYFKYKKDAETVAQDMYDLVKTSKEW